MEAHLLIQVLLQGEVLLQEVCLDPLARLIQNPNKRQAPETLVYNLTRVHLLQTLARSNPKFLFKKLLNLRLNLITNSLNKRICMNQHNYKFTIMFIKSFTSQSKNVYMSECLNPQEKRSPQNQIFTRLFKKTSLIWTSQQV